MTASTKPRVGVGCYAVSEAARLLGAPVGSVRRWADPASGLIQRYFDDREDVLTFAELMELHFIKLFRAEGVSLATIRRASQAASRKLRSEFPFSVKRFDTDGRTIFATLIRQQDDKEIVEDLKRGQFVFDRMIRPFFRKIEYGDGEMRYWPLERPGRIVLDPARQFGKPIDAHSGVRTSTIRDAVMANGGQDHAAVARWLDIPLTSIEAALAFERSLAA